MSDMIADTARRLFADHAERAFAALPPGLDHGAVPWLEPLWQAVEEMGFPLALLSEDEGGFGLEPADALGIIRLAAAQAIPLPLAETMLANWLLSKAGLEPASGPATFAACPELEPEGAGWRLRGTVPAVAWGRHAATLVLLDPAGRLARVEQGAGTLAGAHNLAGEPRDTLSFDTGVGEVAELPLAPETLRALGALLRAQGMAGALEAVLERSVAYANERVQFGRPIGKFQAIQQALATLAGNTAAARAGAEMAGAGLGMALHDPARFTRLAAAAKIRAGEAAGSAASISHQVHGAIGFTREYALHPLTTRLWSWRDEFGTETEWSEWLGTEVLTRGAAGFWPLLTGVEEA